MKIYFKNELFMITRLTLKEIIEDDFAISTGTVFDYLWLLITIPIEIVLIPLYLILSFKIKREADDGR
jgi:hypothetical protein